MITKQQRIRHFLWLSLFVLPIDQLSKWLFRRYLEQPYHFDLGPFFIHFELAENQGAFLSFGSGWSQGLRFWVLTVAVFFVLIWAAWSILKTPTFKKYEYWGLQFLLVGGIGNLIDRAYKSTVTDFVQVGVSVLRTGIFNIVDMLILASLFLMILGPLFEIRKAKFQNE